MLQAQILNYMGQTSDEVFIYHNFIAQNAPMRGDPEIGNLIEVAEEYLQARLVTENV